VLLSRLHRNTPLSILASGAKETKAIFLHFLIFLDLAYFFFLFSLKKPSVNPFLSLLTCSLLWPAVEMHEKPPKNSSIGWKWKWKQGKE